MQAIEEKKKVITTPEGREEILSRMRFLASPCSCCVKQLHLGNAACTTCPDGDNKKGP